MSMASIMDKKILLIGGGNNEIIIIETLNFECVKIIKNVHDKFVKKFETLKTGKIFTISQDRKIKLWDIEVLENQRNQDESKSTLFLSEDSPLIKELSIDSLYYN
jgi:WD40 repeat protein